EQGGDLAEAQGRRLAWRWLAEVAHEVDQRRLHAVGADAAVAAIVHPGPATLALAGIRVQVELAQQAALRILDAVEAHVLVPKRRGVRLHLHLVERLDDAEQAGEHLRFGDRQSTR